MPIWGWIVVLGVPISLSAAFWVPLLIRNRKHEPGEQTLQDYRMKHKAQSEMMIRRSHPNRNKTSKL